MSTLNLILVLNLPELKNGISVGNKHWALSGISKHDLLILSLKETSVMLMVVHY